MHHGGETITGAIRSQGDRYATGDWYATLLTSLLVFGRIMPRKEHYEIRPNLFVGNRLGCAWNQPDVWRNHRHGHGPERRRAGERHSQGHQSTDEPDADCYHQSRGQLRVSGALAGSLQRAGGDVRLSGRTAKTQASISNSLCQHASSIRSWRSFAFTKEGWFDASPRPEPAPLASPPESPRRDRSSTRGRYARQRASWWGRERRSRPESYPGAHATLRCRALGHGGRQCAPILAQAGCILASSP